MEKTKRTVTKQEATFTVTVEPQHNTEFTNLPLAVRLNSAEPRNGTLPPPDGRSMRNNSLGSTAKMFQESGNHLSRDLKALEPGLKERCSAELAQVARNNPSAIRRCEWLAWRTETFRVRTMPTERSWIVAWVRRPGPQNLTGTSGSFR